MKTIFAIVVLSLGFTSNAAIGAPIALEFDPVTTSLGARNLLVYYQPVSLQNLTFSAIAFSADFPEWMDKLMSYPNKDKQISSKINWSPGVGFDYFFDPDKKGMHLGLIAFLWNYEISRNGQKANFSNLELLPRIGYRYFPSESGFYFDLFAGVQSEFRAAGSNQVDGSEYETTPILPFGTIHVGFQF